MAFHNPIKLVWTGSIKNEQVNVLRKLLTKARFTDFGQYYDFDKNLTVR